MFNDCGIWKVTANFLKMSNVRELLFGGEMLKVTDEIKDYLPLHSNGPDERKNSLGRSSLAGAEHLDDAFRGKKFVALKLLLGDRHACVLRNIWERKVDYTFTSGINHRSYRTRRATELYMDKLTFKLMRYASLENEQLSLDKYLDGTQSDYKDISASADIIALEIDSGDDNVFNCIREMICSENNNAVITKEILQGLMMSKNEKAHALVADLLLAAKLQEGLRQAILESMNEGSRECFVYLMKVILDHGLTRFSSVVHAFANWTGLGVYVEKQKIVNKCFETAYRCITDKAFTLECLASQDTLLIYIALWAISFDEVEDLDYALDDLLKSDEKFKRQIAHLFIKETPFSVYKHQLAYRGLDDPELDVAAIACMNLFDGMGVNNINYDDGKWLERFFKNGTIDGRCLFDKLCDLLERLPKRKLEFKGVVFPWMNVTLSAADILDKMLMAVAQDYNDDLIDLMIGYKDKMTANARSVLVGHFLKTPKNEKQQLALIGLCGDRQSSVRLRAFEILGSVQLSESEYNLIEDLLEKKQGDLRKNCMWLLLRQDAPKLYASILRLTQSENEEKRLAAIDLIGAIDADGQHSEIREASKMLIASMTEISEKEKGLAKHLLRKAEDVTTLDMGLGLFDIHAVATVPGVGTAAQNLKSAFVLHKGDIESILSQFSDLIHENRNYEYFVDDYDGSRTGVILGGCYYLQPFERGNHALENYPLADQVREIVLQNSLSDAAINQLHFCMEAAHTYGYTNYMDWFNDLLEEHLGIREFRCLRRSIKEIRYSQLIQGYIESLMMEISPQDRFQWGRMVSEYLLVHLPKEVHTKEYDTRYEMFFKTNKPALVSALELRHWLGLMKRNCTCDDSFKKYFHIAYNYYLASDYRDHATLDMKDFGRALEKGIIDQNEVYRELLTRPSAQGNLRECTFPRSLTEFSKYDQLLNIRDKVVEVVTAIEVNRGELNTEVSDLAGAIRRCFGAQVFASVILNSETDSYVRDCSYVCGASTKNEMLSHLLKSCYPKSDDSVLTMEAAIGEYSVNEKQLIEAAMYAPQWLDIVEAYLGAEGLKSACWYFHAHVNDSLTEEKETNIARYSPIPAQDFMDGAFDGRWFMEAYQSVGERRFKLIYDSAKYITDGARYKRSQLFADAALGRLDADEVKIRIMEKRNKELLLAYGIIPVINRADLLTRYEYIQQYLKESRRFGSQKQASEGRSAQIALSNLARNAGYSDVNRLSWDMEAAKWDSINAFLGPHVLADIEVQLNIDESGKTTIQCSKNGKELKEIPGKYKKNEYVAQLMVTRKSLNEQYSRARFGFEELMEKGELFEAQELFNLQRNPVLSLLVGKLVYTTGDRLGFLKEGALIDYNGKKTDLNPHDKLMIAHPVHLFGTGEWSSYQRYLFAEKWVQPFKQVFRELYLPNADELAEGNRSRRYSGHLVQPKKTLALLKKRGWLASDEECFQKVFYKENLIAVVTVLADGFNPSNIESTIIELVKFEDRRTNKVVEIASVPKLVFSETMRDLDLVVSVAHVGGVDPEASLSTLEIRTVVLEELMKLLKLQNVTVKGSHAHITGVHGEYTVHLGSGVTHKIGTGALNILPVHSGHQGRLFLPFIDDDPKSVEILSKIVLLAEDSKLKDPSILVQIT